MSLDLTFKEICAHIKKEETELIDATDKLLGIALVCSPIILGPLGFTLLPLISAKNELTKLGKNVVEKFSKKKDSDYLARQDRMRVAYGLICFTAFFEALDKQIPQSIRDEIRLLKDEKIYLSKEALEKLARTTRKTDTFPVDSVATDRFISQPIPLPHPTESLTDQQKRLFSLYEQMAGGFGDFIQRLAFWDASDEKTKATLSKAITKIPELALACYEGQYFELCRKFEDFAVWANLHEHKKARLLIESLSDYVKLYAELTDTTKAGIDIGLASLHEVVTRIPETLKISQAQDIVDGLRRHYFARIDEPIIEDKGDQAQDSPKLVFPKIRNAFVPQSFFVLRQGEKPLALEEPDTWKELDRRDDLAGFLLRYLSSPYSTETPLVILGHPGSGKSLLTTILSAQLLSTHYAPIKVPLREVNSDAGIVAQIEEHIGRVTSIRFDSWARLSGAFKNNPPLVILDGYDELLQASGKVFAGYLKDVQNFQRNEAEQGRPVRVIVTSRVTLIDKAIIPEGSTIVRLLEFNKEQRQCWVSIWNTANSSYFQNSGVKAFELPEDRPDNTKIISLAEQPLLLLMLALYDSENNKLRNTKIRDRTVLYESLLRRFVLRERAKSKPFLDLSDKDKAREVDMDMRRLGVASIGMYNRRKLHILSSELNDDLRFFDLERPMFVESAKALTPAELLLGSFFFVHKSKALQKGIAVDQDELSAFEFLHNTFGEFLAADFIIHRALVEAQELVALGSSDDLKLQRERKLRDADGLSRAWFACLVYTPLFTRPVVLEMIGEWIGHTLQKRRLTKKAFLVELDAIVRYQLIRILSRREMPSIMQREQAEEGFRAPFESYPLLGHMAIYSLNLIILRVIMAGDVYEFDESKILASQDGTKPWDQLTHLWRSWFSIDNLNGITAVFSSERGFGTVIRVIAKDQILTAESRGRLETAFNVGLSLNDTALASAAGLALYSGPRWSWVEIPVLDALLKSEGVEADVYLAMRQLEVISSGEDAEPEAIMELAERAFAIAASSDRYLDLARISELVRVFARRRSGIGWRIGGGEEIASWCVRVLDVLFDQLDAGGGYVGNAVRYLEVIEEFLEIVKETDDARSINRFVEEVFQRFIHPRLVVEVIAQYPDAVLSVRRVFNIAGFASKRWGSRFFEEMFERIVDRRSVRELIDDRPIVVVELLQLASEIGGEVARRFGTHVLQEIGDRVDVEELLLRWPDAAIKLLSVSREFGRDELWLAFGRRVVSRAGSKGVQLPELISNLPELGAELVEVAVALGDQRSAQRFGEMLIEYRPLDERLIDFLRRDIGIFAKLVRCVRLLNSTRGAELIRRALSYVLEQPGGARFLWSRIPLSAARDLRWVADRVDDRRLRSLLSHPDDAEHRLG